MWAEFNEQKKGLKKQIELLDDQIDGIQGALIHIANDEGLATICGSEYEASIKLEQKNSFPIKSRDMEEYGRFERMLMESGHWDMVSGIDQAAIKSIWKSPTEVPEDLSEILGRFVHEEESTRISIRKRKGQI